MVPNDQDAAHKHTTKSHRGHSRGSYSAELLDMDLDGCGRVVEDWHLPSVSRSTSDARCPVSLRGDKELADIGEYTEDVPLVRPDWCDNEGMLA